MNRWVKGLLMIGIIAGLANCTEDKYLDENVNEAGLKTTETEFTERYVVDCEESANFDFGTSANVTLTNDGEYLNFTITGIEDWMVRFLAIYVGPFEDIPYKDDGRIDHNSFNDVMYYSPMLSQVTYQIPISEEWDGCITIVIKIIMIKELSDGSKLTEYDYVLLNGLPYFDYCFDCCEVTGYRTQTPGGWGAPAKGNNPGSYRDAYFDMAFPEGLMVGLDGEGFSLTLSSAYAVEHFLPSGGKPLPLTMDYVDPTSDDLGNTLAGHVVALSLSVGFDYYDEDFGASDFNLGDLVLSDETGFGGMTVNEVLDHANTVLGGGSSMYSASQLQEILDMINNSFVDGQYDSAYDIFECEE
ncbi:hypothetical protein [Carboxylicivirga taeanensis]|uniref:hypothetical protein n=1 Tax=Carboxylicivirga taeanensis TaxID=1416875 RepID=UPI003F6DDD67